MTETDTKGALKSVTVWGGLLAVLPFIADSLTELASVPGIPDSVAIPVAAVGGTLAIVGRFLARVSIKLW